jgi:hypothetical protein
MQQQSGFVHADAVQLLPCWVHIILTCLAVLCCAVLSPCTGEINTLQGNLNWVASRQTELEHPVWAGREEQLLPLCNAAGENGLLQLE